MSQPCEASERCGHGTLARVGDECADSQGAPISDRPTIVAVVAHAGRECSRRDEGFRWPT